MYSHSKVCMIGGSGRSGTTILNKIFANHPDMTDVPEWRFLVDPDGIIDFYMNSEIWSPYHYDLKVKRLESLLKSANRTNTISNKFYLFEKKIIKNNIIRKINQRYSNIAAIDSCPNYMQIVNNLIDNLTLFRFHGEWVGMKFMDKKELYYNSHPSKDSLKNIFRNFLQQIVDDVLQYQDAKYYLEKNTWNILWFDKILELIPQAKMVHIYRDPRDVVASYTKQSWMPSDPIKSAIIYRDIIEQWWEIKKELPEKSFLEISLESLVSEPHFVLKKICSFWDIDWNDSLLEIDLSKSNSGRWKKEFTDSQKKEINEILSYQIEAMRYDY